MSKILIVEDEESIADLEKDYLELSGFEVEIENQGDTGLVRAIKEDFDLLILDLMLPEVDGFEIQDQQIKILLDRPYKEAARRKMISWRSAASRLTRRHAACG